MTIDINRKVIFLMKNVVSVHVKLVGQKIVLCCCHVSLYIIL